jgi:hypothetical protein
LRTFGSFRSLRTFGSLCSFRSLRTFGLFGSLCSFRSLRTFGLLRSLRASQLNKKTKRFNPDEISATEISLGKRDKFRWLGSLRSLGSLGSLRRLEVYERPIDEGGPLQSSLFELRPDKSLRGGRTEGLGFLLHRLQHGCKVRRLEDKKLRRLDKKEIRNRISQHSFSLPPQRRACKPQDRESVLYLSFLRFSTSFPSF